MRFSDAILISLHTIRHNAGRTALTALIVAIVSALVMVLMTLGVAFRDNLLRVSKAYFAEHGATYTFRALGDGTSRDEAILPEEYELYRSYSAQYPEVCGDDEAQIDISVPMALTSKGYDGTAESGWTANGADVRGKSFSGVSQEIRFHEGRVWTPADSASRNIFLSRELIREVEAGTGRTVSVGETVELQWYSDPYSANVLKRREYTVAGIYSGGEGTALCYIGMDELFAMAADPALGLRVTEITMTLRPVSGDYDFDEFYGHMRAFTEKMNDALPQQSDFLKDFPELQSFYRLFAEFYVRFSCDFVDVMSVVNILSSVAVAVFFLLALAVLLLSVGSVANSVVISVDKNRKFFGMMKAVGLDAKGTRKLVYTELLFIVAVGVALGMGLLFAFHPLLSFTISSLFSYLVGAIAVFETRVAVPFWLPLAAAAFFLLLTALFSRGSVAKIAAQDVMATLSEVE